MSIELGGRVGDYEIVSEIGAGGMGKVFRVRNIISGRIEAMKVLLPSLTDTPELADRFTREIKVQAALNHPNIASLHTAFHFENQLVMVMEFVEGVSLDKKLKEGPIPLEDSVNYAGQVLRALSYAHKSGVIHRDVKPANMMLMPDGTVKLMDFGIAKVSTDPKLTGTGVTVGSLFYMSPEQIRGQQPDPRSDLYSLGISLYEMVTGRRPIQGDSDFSIMSAHLNANPVAPIEIDHAVPAALNAIILMAIAKEPGQRFQTADAFLNALESISKAARQGAPALPPLGIPIAAVPPPPPPPPPHIIAASPSSHRGLYLTLGAVAVIGVFALAAYEAPRWLKTSARGEPHPVEQTAPAASPSSPAPSAPTEPPQSSTAPSATAPPNVPAEPLRSQPSAQPTEIRKPSQSRESTVVQQAAAPAPVTRQAQTTTPAVQSPATPPPQQQQPQPTQTQSTPAQPPPVSAEELEKLDVRMTQLGARAASADQGLESLRRSQAASGLSPRADAVTAQHLMRTYLAQAQSAMQSQDIRAANRLLGQAESQIEKLEQILGR